MQKSTIAIAAGTAVLAVVAAVSALFLTIGGLTSVEATTEPVVVTEYVDAAGVPVAASSSYAADPEASQYEETEHDEYEEDEYEDEHEYEEVEHEHDEDDDEHEYEEHEDDDD